MRVLGANSPAGPELRSTLGELRASRALAPSWGASHHPLTPQPLRGPPPREGVPAALNLSSLGSSCCPRAVPVPDEAGDRAWVPLHSSTPLHPAQLSPLLRTLMPLWFGFTLGQPHRVPAQYIPRSPAPARAEPAGAAHTMAGEVGTAGVPRGLGSTGRQGAPPAGGCTEKGRVLRPSPTLCGAFPAAAPTAPLPSLLPKPAATLAEAAVPSPALPAAPCPGSSCGNGCLPAWHGAAFPQRCPSPPRC